MKYIVEITKDKMIKKFIDDEGKEYVNTWVVQGPGETGTLETSLDDQMEQGGIDNEELLEAVYDEDLHDIWEAIRNA
ncbi:hypothetical protein [Clostridium tetani]|uniref:hypothetical protein n=1 Tax=Clostridium tetani TaxID=1513 RepID=UPI00100BE007|nr:hypothetical protein [Clostridium tetani]RXM79601.1 hypothetical protein DP154_01985 [Clostridium tetani]RYV00415.1 hypothetical protein DP144_01990 [Clostridium tetani]BDR86100.1 hypothetical protein N071400001_07080 [Clostridium tetani]